MFLCVYRVCVIVGLVMLIILFASVILCALNETNDLIYSTNIIIQVFFDELVFF